MNDLKAKLTGLLSGAQINLSRAENAIEEAKGVLAMIRAEIATAQRDKALVGKKIVELSKKGGRRYTQTLHRADEIALRLRQLQEDRISAKYLLDQARLSRLKCRSALAKVYERL